MLGTASGFAVPPCSHGTSSTVLPDSAQEATISARIAVVPLGEPPCKAAVDTIESLQCRQPRSASTSASHCRIHW